MPDLPKYYRHESCVIPAEPGSLDKDCILTAIVVDGEFQSFSLHVANPTPVEA